MTIRDTFRLFIKLFSLYYFFWGFISLLENFISTIHNELISITNLWFFLTSLAYIGLFFFLFYKTDFIISILNIKKEFLEKTVSFGKLNSTEIIKIVLLTTGFLLFLDNISEFISHCFYAFKYSTQSKVYIDNSYSESQYLRWTISGINILIGYLIIFNHKRLGNWIEKKQQ